MAEGASYFPEYSHSLSSTSTSCMVFLPILPAWSISILLKYMIDRIQTILPHQSYLQCPSLREVFSFMRSDLLIVDLSVGAIRVLFRKLSLVSMSSRLFPTFSSMVLYWGLRFTWIWVLCRMIDMDPFAFFYMPTFSYASTFYWRWVFFPLYNFGLCQKSSVHRCVDLLLDLCFGSIDPHVCLYASTNQFLWL